MSTPPKNTSQRAPDGLERALPKLAPSAVLASTLLPALCAWASRAFPVGETPAIQAKNIQTLDFMLFGFSTACLTAIATILFGCMIVRVLKGPAITADSYELPHADKPTGKPRDDGPGSEH
jgi:hypothetical protein